VAEGEKQRQGKSSISSSLAGELKPFRLSSQKKKQKFFSSFVINLSPNDLLE
jgi:hypothetical protein